MRRLFVLQVWYDIRYMKKNEGILDRVLRLLIGLVLVWVGVMTLGGVFGIVLAVVGVGLLFTAATGWCALYSLLGLITAKKTDGQQQ